MTNKSTKRRNAVIAAIAGAALLLGGSTYALWSATANMNGGTIQSGNLAIVAGDSNAWDVSQDRSDSQGNSYVKTAETGPVAQQTIKFNTVKPGHAIEDLEKWTMVPGDTVALTFPYEITLDGDNLVAKLSLKIGDDVKKALKEIIPGSDNVPYLSMSYELAIPQKGEQAPGALPGGRAITLGELTSGTDTIIDLSYFQAANQLDGQEDGSIPMVDGSNVYVLVVYITFSDQTPGQDKTSAKLAGASLLSLVTGNLTATLEQVRCTGADTEGDSLSNFPVCS